MDKRTVTLNGAEFTLGDKYKDSMLGIEGIAAAGVAYLTGCDQVQLKLVDATGCPVEHWVDVTNIEAVKVQKRSGGPAPRMPARHP